MAGDITDFAPIPTELRIRMLALCERGFVVVDKTKFGRLTPIRLAPIPGGTGLIVDAEPPGHMKDALIGRGLDVIVAD
jgi:DeoR/GlpR family transcriptional regulator of sugar metabolism